MAKYVIDLPEDMDHDNRLWASDQLDGLGLHAGKGWLRPLAKALHGAEPLLNSPLPKPPTPNITLAGEIRPGGWYVLRADRNLRPQEAMRIREKCDQLFPGATFAILDKAVELVTELPDLRDAVERARGKAKEGRERWASDKPMRKMYHNAAVALELLARELGPQERDGAGALPNPSEPVAATDPPAPSRKLTCTCGRISIGTPMEPDASIAGLKDGLCDMHGYRDREAAEAGLCGWRHPCYPDIACTVRDGQWHGAHSSHDARGDIHWNSEIAAQAPTAARAAKDWPEWKGLP